MKKENKFHICLYGVDNTFQGYLKSLSTYNSTVKHTDDISNAKSYANLERAKDECNLISIITHGGLVCKIL